MQAGEAEELACALVRMGQVVREGHFDGLGVNGEEERRAHLRECRAA
jgi:hypothetical protein